MSRTRFCMYRISAEMNWTNGALMALVVVNSSWGIPPHCQKVSRVLNVVISCTFETFMFCYWFSSSAPQKASRPSRWHLNLEQSIRIFGGLMCCVHVTRGTKVHVKLCILQTRTEIQEGLHKSSKSQGAFTHNHRFSGWWLLFTFFGSIF